MPDIKALLFDLYGTLVIRQERQFLREIARYYLPVSHDPAMLSKLGTFGLDLIRKLMVTDLDTATLPDDVLALFPHTPSDTLEDLRQSFREALRIEARATRLIPGVKHMLAFFRARGHKIGVVSNASTLHKQPLFDFDLARFCDTALFSCDLGYAKPDPAIYHLACRHLDVAPEHALFVGDSYNMDVKTPLALGMQAIHISKSPRHSARITTVTELGLWALEPELRSFLDLLNAHPDCRRHHMRFDECALFPNHPDRQWLTYLCDGRRAGQAQTFRVQRALTTAAAADRPAECLEIAIDHERFRITPCVRPDAADDGEE